MSSAPFARVLCSIAVVVIASALAVAPSSAVQPGSIVVSDDRGPNPPLGSGPGAIVQVDPVTGAQQVLASGDFNPGGFHGFRSMVREADGRLLVTGWDETAVSGGVARIDPETGSVTILVSGGLMHYVFGVAEEASGALLVSDDDAGIIRVATDGTQSIVTSGGLIVDPEALVVDATGSILVADSLSDAIVRVDPVTGAQSVVSQAGLFFNPSGLVVDRDGTILVADENCCAVPAGDPWPGGVIRVDPATGAQTLVSGAGLFARGVHGLALDAAGDILVADRIGGIIRVDPATGAQTLVSSGDNLQEPVNLVAWPGAPPAPSLLRIARCSTPMGAPWAVFGTVPCTTPGPDFVICSETTVLQDGVANPTMPVSISDAGALVYIEYDSDLGTPGTPDVITVTKGAAGTLSVGVR